MSARKLHDLCVAVGKYTDREGKEKSRWLTVGVEMETEQGGRFILMDRSFNPAGVPYDATRGNQILLSLFGEKAGAAPGKSAAGQPQGDEEIPF